MRKNSSARTSSRNPRKWVATALASLLAGQGGLALAQALEPVSDKDKAKSSAGESIEWGFAKPGGVLPPTVDMIEGGGLRLPESGKQVADQQLLEATEKDKKDPDQAGSK